MKAFILAAGKGERLRPLTEKIPKVMLKIGNKPILEHNLNLARNAGAKEIFFNLHYLPEIVKNYFGNGKKFGVKIRYSFEKKLLGSAGAVKKMGKWLKSGDFFVIYGDNFSNCDLLKSRQAHFKNKGIATIVLFDINKNKNSGIGAGRIILDKRKKYIKEFLEGQEYQRKSNLVNAGIYILKPEILKYIPENKFYDFGRDLFPNLLKKKIKIAAYLMPKNEFLFGIDNLECYQKTKNFYDYNANSI